MDRDDKRDGVFHIFGGGTVSHVRPHLALAAPAYGGTARAIEELLRRQGLATVLHLTRMAGGALETNEDVAAKVDEILRNRHTRVVFMSAALCDFDGHILDDFGAEDVHASGWAQTPSGKDQPRLKTSLHHARASKDGPLEHIMRLTPAGKIISRIRKERKDVFLVGFKTTAGATRDDQYLAGLRLLKESSCNLVLANDVHTRLNMVITPEQAAYHETTERSAAVDGLVEMAVLRSGLTFTRSTVVPGEAVPWGDERVPEALRVVVDWCVSRGAYKPFLGSTVGHFAVRLGNGLFLTSRRKTDFNRLREVGLVLVETQGDYRVVAHGFKPSVGGQSQRIVFAEHPDADCIVHFHCPLRPGSRVPVRSQREYECGSHECGRNTSHGLARFDLPEGGHLYAVMLDRHGPNVVFSRDTSPHGVVRFIEENFDLGGRTDDVSAPQQAEARP